MEETISRGKIPDFFKSEILKLRFLASRASNYNKTMSVNLQIIPAYFGPTRHKFDILSHTDDSGKTTEYFIPTQFSNFFQLSKGSARKNIRNKCPGRIKLSDLVGGTLGGYPLGRFNQPDTILVQESELYEFLFACRNPFAKQFRKWVCNDVLPQIRQRGFYAMPGVNIPQPLPPIQYVEKSHEQRLEEFETLACGCVYRRGAGTMYSQCFCVNKDERIQKRRENVAEGEKLKGGVQRSAGKKGGLQRQANIRAMEERCLRFQKENGELISRNAELELLLLNLNLNGDE